MEARSRVSLPLGTEEEQAYLPDGWGIDLVAPMGPADLPDPAAALTEALDSPIHSLPLAKRLPASDELLVVACPECRRDGTAELLDVLLAYLGQQGCASSRIHLGPCGPSFGRAELAELLGEERIAAHPIFERDPKGSLRAVGHTSLGTPVAFDRGLWDFALIVVVGRVAHHPVLGFSGARELLVRCAAAPETIRTAMGRSDPQSGQAGLAGRLARNAAHADLLEAALLPGLPVFAIHCIRGSRPGAFAGFWAGDLRKAHHSACKAYLGWRVFAFQQPFDLLLSASGGDPLDRDPIACLQGLANACGLLAPGGVAIHLAACSDPEPARRLGALAPYDPAALRARLLAGFDEACFAALAARERAAHHRILLVSGLAEALVRELGLEPASSFAEALERIIPELPPNHRTALFPDAAGLLPMPGRQASLGPLVS
ncbi:MAG: DUF2088 domain-containing protein [Deltaproteobacteria bacterium]|nr:DUF2088 domain-containing protein [Deltaproteobacteria bacterium]